MDCTRVERMDVDIFSLSVFDVVAFSCLVTRPLDDFSDSEGAVRRSEEMGVNNCEG